jgi:hypothetical protein
MAFYNNEFLEVPYRKRCTAGTSCYGRIPIYGMSTRE